MNAETARAPVCESCKDVRAARRLLALCAVNLAREELDRIANSTGSPDSREVEAADLLDAVHAMLAREVLP